MSSPTRVLGLQRLSCSSPRTRVALFIVQLKILLLGKGQRGVDLFPAQVQMQGEAAIHPP